MLCFVLFIFFSNSYSYIRAQEVPNEESNKPVVDTIDYDENLLDSNAAYKQQFDSLSKDGDWLKLNKSDFVRDLSEDTGEDLDYSPTTEVIYVWRPYCSNAYWNPYYEGSWVFSRYGWMWISNYNWGWGPYNYGRWYCSNMYGWIWLPGTIWAANWVTWRYHSNYIGWYPTCPRIYWRNYRNEICTNRLFSYIPRQWVFVSTNNFLKTVDKNIIVNSNENAGMLKNSQKIKTAVYIDPGNPKFKYSGPDVNVISKETGEKILPKDVEATGTKSKQFTDGNTVFTYKKETTASVEGNSRTNKSETGDKNAIKKDNSNGSKPGDKSSSTTGTKKGGNKQNKGSIYKEGSNESNTEKSNKGSRESNTGKKVEKSGRSNDSNNDNVKKEGSNRNSKK